MRRITKEERERKKERARRKNRNKKRKEQGAPGFLAKPREGRK